MPEKHSKKLARELEATGDLSSAFIALERAHFLGQRYLIPNIVNLANTGSAACTLSTRA